MNVDFLIYTGKIGTEDFKKLAKQRDATLNRGRDTIDTSSKDGEGFAENEPGLGNWGIDGGGLLVEDDAAFIELEEAFMEGVHVNVQFRTGGGNIYQGKATITDFPIEAAFNSERTYSITLEGSGKPQKTPAATPPQGSDSE